MQITVLAKIGTRVPLKHRLFPFPPSFKSRCHNSLKNSERSLLPGQNQIKLGIMKLLRSKNHICRSTSKDNDTPGSGITIINTFKSVKPTWVRDLFSSKRLSCPCHLHLYHSRWCFYHWSRPREGCLVIPTKPPPTFRVPCRPLADHPSPSHGARSSCFLLCHHTTHCTHMASTGYT